MLQHLVDCRPCLKKSYKKISGKTKQDQSASLESALVSPSLYIDMPSALNATPATLRASTSSCASPVVLSNLPDAQLLLSTPRAATSSLASPVVSENLLDAQPLLISTQRAASTSSCANPVVFSNRQDALPLLSTPRSSKSAGASPVLSNRPCIPDALLGTPRAATSPSCPNVALSIGLLSPSGLKYGADNDCCGETDGDTGLSFLGNAKYGVKISSSVLARICKLSKTPEKLALNLIPVILTKEEIESVTVYGNRQFYKEPMDNRKREAIKSCIFEVFPRNDMEKKEGWEKIVTIINDKIRGLKKGKYKSAFEQLLI
ncbi:uncharacterized protein LOC110457321 [Mizuhopecten yessoensis]|uniref:uncharacterized protein LOC110457321 n=1 Tax=Mizuhopecten yessoensis TaxID=6573 RepID=UPI000B45AB82|nr:uncharacterized protein LOC110457321 [Mizuhopecten yessoensis]XP_021364213.1 uncharacterized protein LOC110457321 [Mizuhopecten yessoensis]